MVDKFELRAWTINLRAWIFGLTCLVFKTTCVDIGKALREGAFSFTRKALFLPLGKKNTHDKAKGLRITSEGHIGEGGLGDEERGRRGVMVLGRLRGGDCVPLGEETTYIYI